MQLNVCLNGRLIPAKKASISIDDRGFLVGDGVYETIRVINGKPFLLREHLKRLFNSLKGISLVLPQKALSIEQDVFKLIRKNGLKEAALRLTVTRGPGPHGFDPRLCKTPTVLIQCNPYQPYPSKFYTRGITVALVGTRRNSPNALPPTVKTISCHNNILAKIEANRWGADEALMLGADGTLAEGTICNVFIVKKNVVITPPLDGRVLAGVTRGYVLKLARKLRYKTVEKKVSVHDLQHADEVFLTSSLMDVMPVGKIIFAHDGKRSEKEYSGRLITAHLLVQI